VGVFFSAESLTESFGTGTNLSYMINDAGDILVHPNHELVRAAVNVSAQPFIESMRESEEQNWQTLYTGDEGRRFFGAFTKLGLGNAAVITSIEYDLVFEGIAATTRRNIYLTIAVLCISILFVWLFSKTISKPLKILTAAARRIQDGEFNLELTPKTKDDIGLLTGSFSGMGRALRIFGHFTNKMIAVQAMKGESEFRGETKNATIFFSDIRSFTAISEKLRQPEKVVSFLNDYMTRMVQCVNKSGGNVDKFIGDAVMAVWGAPNTAGSPAADALACIKAALMMRISLRDFNKSDKGKALAEMLGIGENPLRIGCGINTGEVVAGAIGFDPETAEKIGFEEDQAKMEYTVIGDPVNLASRTESLNKPLGTDILITENTWKLIGKYLITEEMPPVHVKGKEEPVRLFAVINFKAKAGEAQRKPETLAEVRQILGITPPDLSKVNTDAEEKKYKIGSEG
jgi:adenylate cyclase